MSGVHERIKNRKNYQRPKPMSKEEEEYLGIKNLTVQGFGDLLDVEKIVTRMTPQQLAELKLNHNLERYGVQSNDTMRDVLLKANELQTSFMELPAIIRDRFRNDRFAYHDWLQENKNNKYALSELVNEITGSEFYKQQLEIIKNKEAEQLKLEQIKNDTLVQTIKKALTPDQPDPKK